MNTNGGAWRRAGLAGLAVLGLLLAACLPEGMQVPQNPGLAALARKSGRIAYLGLDGNLYTMDQTGGGEAQITSDAVLTGDGVRRYYNYPAWSPDGRRLAFVRLQAEGSRQSAALVTADRDGQNLVEAFTDSAQLPFYLYWAPDSDRVSFLASAGGSSDLLLRVVPAAGGEAQTLDAGQPYYWHWSPDGTQLLVHVGGAAVNAGARLAVLGLGDNVLETGLEYRPTFFQAPAWSPDGRQALLAVETEEGGALIIADGAGVEQERLATFDGGVAFGWAPDGRRVAYIAGQANMLGTLGKLSLVTPGRPDEAVAIENEPVLAFFWAPNSRSLAYFVPEIVSPTPEPGQDDGLSGTFLLLHLFVADLRGRSQQVASFVPTREFYNLLPYFDQYQHSATIWSPDSQNLVLSAYGGQEGRPGIFVVHSSGNLSPRFLREGTLALWSPK